ncbi:ECF transporter S component [Bacteroides sp.]|uniref:ECF transporter S component n=1 Tax=Bacteroides sp. TaxID=29523 RepID=UPI0025C470A2|nr:ECF transporter S component [Bacteroides sp.]
MKTKTLNLYSLNYKNVKTYYLATLFVVGNILLPQLFHLVPQGGVTWLPVYFFTLIAAYKYGWKVGLLTAILSPVLNLVLFGMPSPAVLPAILIKSSLLALSASLAANRFNRISIPILIGIVLAYQITGTLIEWPISGSLYTAFQDFRIAIPGMLLQVFGGYAIMKYVPN